MSVIYKYPIKIVDEQTIDMPFGANIISLQMQNGAAVMWAIVNPKANLTSVKIRIFGTGEEIPSGSALRYIGTIHDRKFVWHVFIDDKVYLNPIAIANV